MRIVVHGQQAFGKAVLEALLKRGEEVVAVYVAPEKEGAKADPLKEAALAAKLPVYQPASYRKPEVWEEFRALDLDQPDPPELLHGLVDLRRRDVAFAAQRRGVGDPEQHQRHERPLLVEREARLIEEFDVAPAHGHISTPKSR